MKYMRARRCIAHFLIKIIFIVLYGWLPQNITARISACSEDTGELVIHLHEESTIEPKPPIDIDN